MARYAAAFLCAVLAAQPVVAADFRAAADTAVVLYDAPSIQGRKLYIVSQGYPLEVLVALHGWVKVRDANGALSWVETQKVSAKQRTVMVKIPLAHVREAANETSPVVFQVQQNVILNLTEVAGSWLRVRHHDGASGYIRAAQVWGV